MIFVIMHYGVDRNQQGRSWISKAVAFAGAATAAGALAGLALGALGTTIPPPGRAAAGLTLAALGFAIGGAQCLGIRVRVLQRNCETGQLWMHTGALTGAVLNGSALGLGFVTRVGYWAWYVVPVAAVLSGSPLQGALVFGCYGCVRGIAPAIVIGQMLLTRGCGERDITRVQEWMIGQSSRARRLAELQLLLAAGAAAAIWVS